MLDEIDDQKERWFTSLHDPKHRVIRYVLKIGNLEEAIHVFIDLLEMRVFSYVEYDDGTPDGGTTNCDGKWSRTLVGYGKTNSEQVCLQLNLNFGIIKYERGNHVHAVEIQLKSLAHLRDVGLREGIGRNGKACYYIDCDGYQIEVVKSKDGKNRISCVVLNCEEPITLSGPTVGFWTLCLGFEIICWSTDPKTDNGSMIEYTQVKRVNLCCCPFSRSIKKRSTFKPLSEGELPYVELQYGCTNEFCVRLQSLPKDVPIDIGTGMEHLYLTCSSKNLNLIRQKVDTVGKILRASETKKVFLLIPGRTDIGFMGVVVTDPSGLQLCFYDDEDIGSLVESELDAEMKLRMSIARYKKRQSASTNKRKYVENSNYKKLPTMW